jgi:YD repeat-containing protein
MTDANGAATYTYDDANRLTEESKVDDLLSAVDYVYDEANGNGRIAQTGNSTEYFTFASPSLPLRSAQGRPRGCPRLSTPIDK